MLHWLYINAVPVTRIKTDAELYTLTRMLEFSGGFRTVLVCFYIILKSNLVATMFLMIVGVQS